jgi:sensor histidine kinase regulating citrate/malate metabolism
MGDIELLKIERKRLLQETEALLSMISTPVLIVNQIGIVIHTNTFAENLWGRSQITLINKQLLELIDSSKLMEFVQQGKPTIDLHVQIKDSMGIFHPYSVACTR